MHECIKPYQFVKEDKSDYLIFKGNRYYIHTKYAGVVEVEKEYFEKLEKRGVEVRWVKPK